MKKYLLLSALFLLLISCSNSNRSLDKQFIAFNKEILENEELLANPISFLSEKELAQKQRLEIIKRKLNDCDKRIERLKEDYTYGTLNSKNFNLEVVETRRNAVRLIKSDLATPLKKKNNSIQTSEQASKNDENKPPEDKLKQFYDYVPSTKKVDESFLGDYSSYLEQMADSNNRVTLYKNLAKAGFKENEIGNEQQFHDYFNVSGPLGLDNHKSTTLEDNIRKLQISESLREDYDYFLSTNKASVESLGDFDTFSKLMTDTNVRVKAYNNMINVGFTTDEIGTEQQFHDHFNKIFYNKKN